MANRTPVNNFAVIGAGLAGATVTRRLLDAGKQVTVYDKSRGTGGRLSNCRLGDPSQGGAIADLGAPWFHPKSPEFQQWLEKQPNGHTFQPIQHDFSGDQLESSAVISFQPSQGALTRQLITGAEFKTQCRIGQIIEGTEIHLRLLDESGECAGNHDAVIITTPAPQAAPLLHSPLLQHSQPEQPFSSQATAVNTLPCWVLVLQLASPLSTPVDIFCGDHPVFARVIRDSAKPGHNVEGSAEGSTSRTEVWHLEANSTWSNAHKNADKDAVTAELIAAFEALIFKTHIDEPLTILQQRTHRWLYGRHQQQLTLPYLWDKQSHIGACGDWFSPQPPPPDGNGGCEAAWFSANALADLLLTN